MFWIGLIVGINIGILVMGLIVKCRNTSDDECGGCRAEQRRIVSGLEDTIHGLKSTKGALAKELQHLSFMNSGYRAR
jgi:hypothetical protein